MNFEKLTDNEHKILKKIWAFGSDGVTYADIKFWIGMEESTLKTYLKRMTDKGIIVREGSRARYNYKAVLTEEHYIKAVTEAFIKANFNNNAKDLVSYLLKEQLITLEKL